MQRRDFIKLSLVACATLVLPSSADANSSSYIGTYNGAQTIIIFTYGGASQLAGNLTNLEEIKSVSQSSYDYFGSITSTANACWAEAGGLHMEEMIDAGDMTIFRHCFSQSREDIDNKAHGICTKENQKGSLDPSDENAGIVSNLGKILESKGVVTSNTALPFVTFEGNSQFYLSGSEELAGYLKPAGLSATYDNPYTRIIKTSYKDNVELNEEMDSLAKSYNTNGDIQRAFDERTSLSAHISALQDKAVGLTTTVYEDNSDIPSNSEIAQKLETAINIMHLNSETKVITIGTQGAGGWDDHDNAKNYVPRSMELFASLKSAVAHMSELQKTNLSIIVFGEFGRNVNLNSANGWDHGNLQNIYLIGGKDYFTHKGVVGETIVDDQGSNRVFLKPKDMKDYIEPFSVAATIYKIFGYTDTSNTLTDGHGPIDSIFT